MRAQAGVAWQTVVASVSLPGLKDWLALMCSRAGSTVDRGISQLHRISCGQSHTSKGITLAWAKKIGFSWQCSVVRSREPGSLDSWPLVPLKREFCFLYISVWYIQIWAKPGFALSSVPCYILLESCYVSGYHMVVQYCLRVQDGLPSALSCVYRRQNVKTLNVNVVQHLLGLCPLVVILHDGFKMSLNLSL